ncbi:hypothetical protein FEM48_Zijuj09G0228600 [Ziziphus jujuba var. spinosa]|uniref:Uncharacterized protein n=1 Tax=Ziziphus jujuba var. spinosa TaxID=714518 RepID=A0A978UVS5_ZIZJJ|nr:hypothetical protein FEM48_Zijuj09G0228600 [Ziziphus jujuba var. spinosa]
MLEDIIAQTQSREKEKEKERVSDLQPTTYQRDTRQKQFLVLEDGSKDKPLDEMHSALELCPDFNALKQTTISTGEGKLNDLYADILHQARISNFDTQTLGPLPAMDIKAITTNWSLLSSPIFMLLAPRLQHSTHPQFPRRLALGGDDNGAAAVMNSSWWLWQ